jgi:lipopolysaccharide transport system ATP-binding protein
MIEADGLGKRYKVGSRRTRGQNLREVIVDTALAPVRNFRRIRDAGNAAEGAGTFWALRDVAFEVEPGEVLGIVGRNGAGKSTLLKILSRITHPTTGYVDIDGRVGSLLEVGTGFHPELTGRDNIFLNGSILGMSRSYIRQRFDEIVDFAGVEGFLDTPVKHYSSGMRVRLAFAVAAHFEPDVLVIDEVLAVGDAEFQRKCLARMDEVGKAGRTVLFVSHDMNAIRRLCTRCLLIDGGRITMDGDTPGVVNHYLREVFGAGTDAGASPGEWIDLSGAARTGKGGVTFAGARYWSDDPGIGRVPYTGGPLHVELALEADRPFIIRGLAVILWDQNRTKLVNAEIADMNMRIPLRAGRNEISFDLQSLELNPGSYVLGLWVAEGEQSKALDFVESAARVEVAAPPTGFVSTSGGVVACRFSVSRKDEQA